MKKLVIERMVLGMTQTNCYYVYSDGAEECLVFDPAERGAAIFDKIKAKGLRVAAILLTHGHFDHIGGADELRSLSGAKIYALKDEQAVLEDPRKNATVMVGVPYTLAADIFVKDAEVLSLAGLDINVIATPGHTIGGACYHFADHGVLFSGDTLFQGSVGRSDLPSGDSDSLVASIRRRLFTLADDTQVYPGHGGATTVGEEKRHNPFV